MAKKRKKSPAKKTQKRKVAKKRGPKKKRGTTRKDASRHSGLDKKFFSRIKQEYFDIDYIDQLSEKEKEWLSSFMEEDLGARFQHNGKKIYRRKSDARKSYTRNNARNRDQYGIAKATGKAVDVHPDQAFQYWEENYIDNDYEDKLADSIESPKKKALLSLEEYLKFKEKNQLSKEAIEFYEEYYKINEK